MISNDFLPIVPSPYGSIASLQVFINSSLSKTKLISLEICSSLFSTNTTLVE